MPNNIMVDLETLSTKPNALIVSIGACKFSIDGVTDTFYRIIDARSNSGHIDANTMYWWMWQSDEARSAFKSKDKVDLSVAIEDFKEWAGKAPHIWGCGAAFDNVILASAYQSLGQRQPWSFVNDRCFRTMRAMFPQVKKEREGTHHNALDDAKHQAEHLIEIWKYIKGLSQT